MAKAKAKNTQPTTVERCNKAIVDFIAKHSDCVTTHTDNGKISIQLNYAGIHDTDINYVSFIANNTLVEDEFELFGLPCKCVFASDTVIRFVGKTTEVVKAVKSGNLEIPSGITVPETVITKSIESIAKRIEISKVVQKAYEKEVNGGSDASKITIYVLSNLNTVYVSGTTQHVTYDVKAILKINAGTKWSDETLRESLKKYSVAGNTGRDMEYGVWNIVPYVSNNSHTVYQDDGSLIGITPSFILANNVKVGDTISSKDYVNYDIFHTGFGYQQSDYDYQRVSDLSEEILNSMIMDGSVILI